MPRSYAVGDVIHEIGSFCSTLLLVLRGSVLVSRNDCNLMQLRKGQHIGEVALFGFSHVWSVTLTAETDCMVCEVERSTFQKAMQNFPEERALFDSVLAMPHKERTAGTASIFEGLSQAALNALDQWTITRLFFPGEMLVQEGEDGSRATLVIVVEGTAAVEITGRVVRSKANGKELDELLDRLDPMEMDPDNDPSDRSPSFFGELGWLGVNPTRSTTVKAQSVCLCKIFKLEALRRIHANSLLNGDEDTFLMERARHDFQPHEEEMPRGNVLCDLSQAGCSQDFLDFLKPNLEVRLVRSGQTLWDSHLPSQLFHSVLWGGAYVYEYADRKSVV